MSFNIVDLVKDQISGQLLGQMGNLLGDESSKAKGAVESMVPALLGGLMGSASTSKGADNLFGAIQDHDDSLLDNLGSLLGGNSASSVVNAGNSVLGNIMGGGALGQLASAVSGFSGLSKGGSSSIMGMLAPILLGVIKRKVLGDGLNAGGLSSLLMGQKKNIASAMPSGFSDQLNASGFLGSFGDAAGNLFDDAVDGAGAAANNVRNAASDLADDATQGARNSVGNVANAVEDGAKKGGSMMRWLLPLIILAALAWLAFKFLAGNGGQDVADTAAVAGDAVTEVAAEATASTTEAVTETATATAEAVSDTAETAADAVSDTAEKATDAVSATVAKAADVAANLNPQMVTDKVTGLFGNVTDAFSGIKDTDSATAALPKLTELGGSLEEVKGLIGGLPEAARGPIADVSTKSMGALQSIINTTMGLPGVGPILEPIAGPLMEKLQELGDMR